MNELLEKARTHAPPIEGAKSLEDVKVEQLTELSQQLIEMRDFYKELRLKRGAEFSTISEMADSQVREKIDVLKKQTDEGAAMVIESLDELIEALRKALEAKQGHSGGR